MDFSNSSSKRSYKLVKEIGMEVSHQVFIYKGLTLKGFKRFISDIDEKKTIKIFDKALYSLFEISKFELTIAEFDKLIDDVNNVLAFYPNMEIELSNDNINDINVITDKLLYDFIFNNLKYDVLSLKENLKEKNIKDEQIGNAFIWICLRISCFQQFYEFINIENELYK